MYGQRFISSNPFEIILAPLRELFLKNDVSLVQLLEYLKVLEVRFRSCYLTTGERVWTQMFSTRIEFIECLEYSPLCLARMLTASDRRARKKLTFSNVFNQDTCFRSEGQRWNELVEKVSSIRHKLYLFSRVYDLAEVR